MSGIPNPWNLNVNIPTVFYLGSLPTINLDIKPLTLEIKPVSVSLDVKPVDVSLRLKELPSIRAHLPTDFTLAFSVAGFELACLSLCGEAQVITEPFHPNPCEICGQAHDTSKH